MGGPLKKYDVTMPSGVTTTMKLNDEDAERLGVLNNETGPEQSEEAPTRDAGTKARTARNKARTASDKGDG
ncbi:hypothetical protein [Streptomyces sp. bgisy154]|uniref:hypothetical protein n=1 Tax=Streptomyces sp. bgisy154 TaxID=3413794 RepID=UPI003D730D56